MTILIEAINVVIKLESLNKIFGDNYDEFYGLIPNQSSYQDKKLLRVGFMVEDDLHNFISSLEKKGLKLFDKNGSFDDFAYVYQAHDLTNKCDWLEIFNIEVEDKILEVCAFKDSSGKIFLEEDKNSFVCSEGWTLDEAIQFHKNGPGKYLRTEISGDGAIDIYIDKNGQIQNIGRKKRWFDYPFVCLLRMPLRLCSITSIIGVIVSLLFIQMNQTLIYKSIWGFFIGGVVGLLLTSQYAKEFPMTPYWVKRLLGGK